MSPQHFKDQLVALTARLAGRTLDAELQTWLNTEYGPTSDSYRELRATCLTGVAQGWLCEREGGGLRYGRIFKPAPELQGFSVDVVDMTNIAGPHHSHPLGEIDLIMPIDSTACFDEHPAGWLVCPPGSAHHPTVTQGRALVLYLLPQGRIDFTRSTPSEKATA
jgi:hypothetical protein